MTVRLGLSCRLWPCRRKLTSVWRCCKAPPPIDALKVPLSLYIPFTARRRRRLTQRKRGHLRWALGSSFFFPTDPILCRRRPVNPLDYIYYQLASTQSSFLPPSSYPSRIPERSHFTTAHEHQSTTATLPFPLPFPPPKIHTQPRQAKQRIQNV